MSRNPPVTTRTVHLDSQSLVTIRDTPRMPSSSSKRTKGREERRSRVLAAAMQLADEGGYDAVQMRSVAERSGVALGTIYRYFSGKDELLIAGLAGWVKLTRIQLEEGRVKGDTPHDRLVWLLERTAASTDEHPMLLSALVTAQRTTSRTAVPYKLEVEREVQALVVSALGPDSKLDNAGVARVIGHVWSSALNRWVSGLAPDGSVRDELLHAASLVASAPPSGPAAAPSELDAWVSAG